MTSRREFLQIGIVASSAWSLATRAARAAGVMPSIAAGTLPLYKVVYDARFPQSVAFAQRALEIGIAVYAIEGDMTRFWYDDLYHRWKQGPVAIAGLTAHGPMFCFEQLARDQRMRVVFRAEHKSAAAGWVDASLSDPAGMLDDALRAATRPDWVSPVAAVVVGCPGGRAEIAAGAGRVKGSDSARGSESLYSWVIAPAVRV